MNRYHTRVLLGLPAFLLMSLPTRASAQLTLNAASGQIESDRFPITGRAGGAAASTFGVVPTLFGGLNNFGNELTSAGHGYEIWGNPANPDPVDAINDANTGVRANVLAGALGGAIAANAGNGFGGGSATLRAVNVLGFAGLVWSNETLNDNTAVGFGSGIRTEGAALFTNNTGFNLNGYAGVRFAWAGTVNPGMETAASLAVNIAGGGQNYTPEVTIAMKNGDARPYIEAGYVLGGGQQLPVGAVTFTNFAVNGNSFIAVGLSAFPVTIVPGQTIAVDGTETLLGDPGFSGYSPIYDVGDPYHLTFGEATASVPEPGVVTTLLAGAVGAALTLAKRRRR